MTKEYYGNYELIFGYDDMKATKDVSLRGSELSKFVQHLMRYFDDTSSNSAVARQLGQAWNRLQKFAVYGIADLELEEFLTVMGEYPIRVRGTKKVYDKFGSAVAPAYYYMNGVVTELLKSPELKQSKIDPRDFHWSKNDLRLTFIFGLLTALQKWKWNTIHFHFRERWVRSKTETWP